ncbi:TerB family tellurite resistance protein [Chitinibacter bivalviorum]|uniref:TerB family tellurite resistance protein n=1 Tax=Chitinibacter bivalviorum TaxID=2739434 RepID=A0A7H9BFL2_9NEIS|nr:TerB family tellurite resistance protein [Chitinibacter bivalviorum]QLG87419.1 TerB family tellurite resistance protein [Chitinibacter bivalviorum]
MKKYANNSPEAMARILVLQMICDGNFDPEEIDELEHLHVYDVLGISRKGFIQVLQDYCNDIGDEADEAGTVHLVDKDRIDQLLETVDEPKKRLQLAALSLDLAKSDQEINDAELAVFSRMLKKWHLNLDDLQLAFDH